ncbi:hypothetical protein TNCV_2133591 [Trichonephila clavipes]|nr:hypothetical protein TNCV_2133591 [Trichonephila clavipes]
MLNEDQSADEVKSASQSESKDMAKNGFQKCFHDFTSHGKSVLLLKGLISKEDVLQEFNCLLGASRHVHSHQNTAGKIFRTETRLKRRQRDTLASRVIVRHTRVNVSLYAAQSRRDEVMAAVLTVFAVTDIVVFYERKLGVLNPYPFSD